MPISIRLSPDVEQKLRDFSEETGRPVSFYLRKIIEGNLNTVLDYYREDMVVKEYKAGRRKTLTQAEVDEKFGIED